VSTAGVLQHCLRSSFFGSDDFLAQNDRYYIYKWRLAWRIRNAIDYSYATGHSSKGIALLHYCNCLQISKPISINFIIFIAVIRNLKLSLVYQSINQSVCSHRPVIAIVTGIYSLPLFMIPLFSFYLSPITKLRRAN